MPANGDRPAAGNGVLGVGAPVAGGPGLTEAELGAGHWLFAQPCVFRLAVADLDQLPPEDLPEVAFAGRSNVGKSSLVNALTGRKTLARTSNTPGRTQQLIYFDLGPEGAPRLTLVDLPGYGFAQVPKSLVEAWTRMLKTFLAGRVSLRRACVLIDGRHGVKKNDEEILDLLDRSAVPYQVVLTKADKVKAPALDTIRQETEAALKTRPAAFPTVLVTSSETGLGIPELRAQLAALAPPAPAA